MWPTAAAPCSSSTTAATATLLVHKGAEFEGKGHVPTFNPSDDPEEWA